MKHLVIHGDPCSGKSLFIKNLLIADNYYAIDGRKTKVFEDSIHWQMTSKDKNIQVLWFHDVNRQVSTDLLISLTERIKINPKAETPFYIKPILVIEFEEEIENLSKDKSLTYRFDIINTNTISYKDLIAYLINWNKNEMF